MGLEPVGVGNLFSESHTMTDLHKAAQQALEIMDGLTDWNHNAVGNNMRLRAASTALREALAKPAVPEVPHGVHHAAKMFVKSDYMGPLARAKLVFDWVASLPAAPQPKDKP